MARSSAQPRSGRSTVGGDLWDWLDYVKRHPLLYRFDGLKGSRCSPKSSFHRTVGEAATEDDHFMYDYMCDEENSAREAFETALKDREDHDEILSRFAEFCECRVTHSRWTDAGLMTYDWKKAPLEAVLAVVDAFGNVDDLVSDYIRDWVMSPVEVYWDIIKDAEGLINEHPPVAVWCHAGDYEIPLEDVFFVCPACHGEPHTEENLKEFYGTQNGYPRFYCGSCASEMNIGDHEDIRDFFIALDVEPYPFNAPKKAEWAKILADRKACGENKLELKVGEQVYIKAVEIVNYSDGQGVWRHYKNEPGQLVTITFVRNATVRNGDITSSAGIGYTYTNDDGDEDSGFIEFHRIYGRAALSVTA